MPPGSRVRIGPGFRTRNWVRERRQAESACPWSECTLGLRRAVLKRGGSVPPRGTARKGASVVRVLLGPSVFAASWSSLLPRIGRRRRRDRVGFSERWDIVFDGGHLGESSLLARETTMRLPTITATVPKGTTIATGSPMARIRTGGPSPQARNDQMVA